VVAVVDFACAKLERYVQIFFGACESRFACQVAVTISRHCGHVEFGQNMGMQWYSCPWQQEDLGIKWSIQGVEHCPLGSWLRAAQTWATCCGAAINPSPIAHPPPKPEIYAVFG